MAMMNRDGYTDAAQEMRDQRAQARQDRQAPPESPAAPAAPAEEPAPPGASGSLPPPSNAGGEMPRNFPVPPVPPPPSPGPVFSLAGSGNGGATSFARPGTAAAKPFRSPIFNANRTTAAAPPRFGAGTAIAGGGGTATPFLPSGLDGGGDSGQAPDELARLLAMLKGAGAGGQ